MTADASAPGPASGATQPRSFSVDRLRVLVFPDRATMGAAAADAGAATLRRLLEEKAGVHAVFASAPSQEEFLRGLAQAPGVDWSRVTAFHLDEYVALPPDAPQAFGQFLRDRLFDRVKPGTVHYLDGNAPDSEAECRRYAGLLREHPLDVAFIGIGENGHIAFNDPHVAKFDDPHLVKMVALDARSREQQVHDGCFTSLDEVPHLALTLTIPAITGAQHIITIVPGPTKAQAVRDTVRGPIAETCPASVLRLHSGVEATLYLDTQSAALL